MNIRLFASLIVLTVLRIIYAGQNGLMPDEAYYHEWSQRLDWWYFSKGPGIALIMRAGTAIFGHTELGVRFFAAVFGLGTCLLMHWLARRLYDQRVAFWTVIVMTVTPIFNAGALIMTIDAPSIFFWTASLCTLWLALEKSPAFSWWWALTGILTGLGFICKMTNAAFLLSAFLLLILTARYRGELLQRGFWSMILCFLPFAEPFIRWNAAHGWPTTAHLAERGGLDTPWWSLNIRTIGEFIGSHFGVYSPLIFFAMMMALFANTGPSFRRWGAAVARSFPALPRSLRSAWGSWVVLAVLMVALWMAGNFFESTAFHSLAVFLAILAVIVFVGSHKDAANMHWKSRFLAAFALPLLLGYGWLALHHRCLPNWTAPAMISLGILTVAWCVDRVLRGVRGARAYSIWAIAIGALVSVVMVNTNILRPGFLPAEWRLPWKRDPGARMQGWREVAARIGEFRDTIEQASGQKIFLIASSYGTAAEVCFYLPEKYRRTEAPGHPLVYVPESPVAQNQFHFWGRYDEYEERTAPVLNDQEDSGEYGLSRFAGRTAIYFTEREIDQSPLDPIPRTFDRWELKTTFEFQSHGLPLRKIHVFLLYRYRPGRMLD